MQFYENESTQRETFIDITKAMMPNADSKPLLLLNERFNNMRHRQILSIPGWQNLIIRAIAHSGRGNSEKIILLMVKSKAKEHTLLSGKQEL